ncbi:hypothetical protein CR513_53521, partial [Mucuna pruriens]
MCRCGAEFLGSAVTVTAAESNSSDPNIGIRPPEDIRKLWYSAGNMFSGVINALSEYSAVDGTPYISSSITLRRLAFSPLRRVCVL